MEQIRSCNKCTEKHDCKKVYAQVGHTKGPSVLGTIFLAFVLPLLFFVVSSVTFERILDNSLDSQAAITAATLLLSGFATTLMIFTVRFFRKKKESCDNDIKSD